MKALLGSAVLGLGMLLSAGAFAEAPAGATAVCKDGTYYSGTTHKGACRGHKGVKEWLNADASAPAPAAADASSQAAQEAKAAPKAKAESKSKSKSKKADEAQAPAAAAPAAAPAGAIALCKDGTYFNGSTHKGACRGHKGVQEWLDGGAEKSTPVPSAAPAPAAPAATPAPAAQAAPATAPAAASKAAPSKRTPPTPASQIVQKPGGGPGLVWVNASSKVYHCQGDPWYGKTKEGSYMSESAAKAAGNHGSHGKDCDTK